MHTSTVVILFVAVCLAFSNADKYSGRFDNLDLDEVLRSDRLLKNYFECLMERGPCTAEGSELKKTIPDALKTECSKCTENQRKKAYKAIKFLRDNKPNMYHDLQEKYDPDGIYEKAIQENLKKTA